MTTLVQDVNAALEELAPAGGVWNSINTAEPPIFPFIVFQRIVSVVNNSLDGPSDLQNTRLQFDTFDRIYSNAAALAGLVELKLIERFSTYPNSCIQLSSSGIYEGAIKAHRVSADYSICSTN